MAVILRILEPAVASTLRTAGLKTFDDFVDCRLGDVVHASSSTVTRRLRLPDEGRRGDSPSATGGVDCYLKIYRYAGKPLPLRLGAGKPLREARNYAILRGLGLDVPDVLAAGSRRSGAVVADGFLLTRAVPNACPLISYWEHHWPTTAANSQPSRARQQAGSTDRQRRHIIRRTAGLVSRMHAANVYHIDLQWRNLLVSPNGTDDPHVYILDCVRGGRRIHPLRRAHGRLRDLSSIFKEAQGRLTRAEQVRWLRYYLGASRLNETHRAIIRAILMDRALKDCEGRV